MSARIHEVQSRPALLDALGSPPSAPRAIVLVGGAGALGPADVEALRPLFATLAEYLDGSGTALVDGGTDSGVMRLIGEARAERDGSFRLIGVLPSGALERTTRDGSEIRLAREHPEFLVVPGTEFGDEVEWLFAAADHLNGGEPAPTLVVNGGSLALEEAGRRLDTGLPVVAVEGSGRGADVLAADEGLRRSGRLRIVPIDVDVAGLEAAFAPSGATGEQGR